MGTTTRLSPAVMSRRRSPRRKVSARRPASWPAQPSVSEAAEPVPSVFMTPLAEAPLKPVMGLAETPGQVAWSPVLDAERDPAREPSVLDMPLAELSWRDPFRWLALGWQDFSRTPGIGLFYGVCFVVMGWLLLAVFNYAPEYTLALSAGFLLMGPFLCLGLYQVSRSLSQGRQPRLLSSLTAWRFSSGQLAIFAAVLLVLEMLWGRAAMIVFAVSFSGVPDFSLPLAELMTEEYLVFFTAYLAVGAVFAGLIYAISVISMPMIMDRAVDAISAGLASMRLVTTQPGIMLLWGALITLLVGLAMLPGFLGLLVAAPVLGHASWHAYVAATKRPADAQDNSP
ncbi:DUF2189 domain-containing protein [Aquabacterium fontiphilum]|jgi:uncharacterized membrane protein|uniref:DUF2189 domain-containing protein n=1 Tax=Aquabacterium fontiphilum TaxID=450365 RepID=UPI001F317DF2|nr:DUF2189 domain-containing protein [Aquabacterium fontiphilum]